ncbi:MAG TPA: UvrB/UvrC motif-containing protein [Gallionella sp.]|nr:UvrB/UvrC motif-containing protein [Gallionella sp.]
MSEKEVAKEIARLEKEMMQAAKNLEFERAAELRDQLRKLKEAVFLSPL